MSFDREGFITGYVECALWADCMPAERYVVTSVNEDDVVSRPQIVDRETDTVFTIGALNDWDRLERFATELNADQEKGDGQGLTMRDGARERMAVDCHAFIDAHGADLDDYCERMGGWSGADTVRGSDARYSAEECAGHDFWYSRNGHGTGFFDRDLGELGDRLQDAASAFGEAMACPFDCGDGTADA